MNESWSAEDSAALYEIDRWSLDYFRINNDGNVVAGPNGRTSAADLRLLVDQLSKRGLDLPVLVRFSSILKDRIASLNAAFSSAIDDHEYDGRYCCVYPIKVNQQKSVISQIVEHSELFGFGLEAGSKPELLAVIAVTNRDTPVICNGFKDDEYVEMALRARKLGRNVIPVVERYSELQQILTTARRLDVKPQIGLRMKLNTRGSGRWNSCGGYRSKFGLMVAEIMKVVEVLEQEELTDCLTLLHFHLGSQITNIRSVKSAVTEATRVYAELKKRCCSLQYLDVGGGLGVDYEGNQTTSNSSMNYTLQEYANDVVFHISTVCRNTGTPVPDIITECGRALTAYHAVLIVETLGVSQQVGNSKPAHEVPDSFEQSVKTLAETLHHLNADNAIESFHDAQQAFEVANGAFANGYLPIDQKVVSEELYFSICRQIRDLMVNEEHVHDDLAAIDEILIETYFCNMSVFQSLPDHWAIGQLFPVMPIHRLNEKPTQQGMLADVTCDSDGRIDKFVRNGSSTPILPLHKPDDEPYYLGIFLVGAYQEILGNLHNLFGDTNVVEVGFSENGTTRIESVLRGEAVRDVLEYVEFSPRELTERLQREIETAVERGYIDDKEAGHAMAFFDEALSGYTYLEKSPTA